MQQKEHPWTWQWKHFHKTKDDWKSFEEEDRWLFLQWIWPHTIEFFRNKDVLDCGCGRGQHLNMIAPYCRSALGIDLHTASLASQTTSVLPNITMQQGNIVTMDLQRTFDVVYSIGVLHHTDDPDGAFRNITKHCRPGGKVIVWVYAKEGNGLNRFFLEPLKELLIHHLPRNVVLWIARILTSLLYVPIYTLYLFTPHTLGKIVLPFLSTLRTGVSFRTNATS